MKSSTNTIYTSVGSSNILRKELLTTALDNIQVLKRYEIIKGIKQRKAEILAELATQLKATHTFLNSFNNTLPKVKVERKPHLTKEKPMKKQKHMKKQQPIHRKLTGLDSEIEQIQRKLREI